MGVEERGLVAGGTCSGGGQGMKDVTSGAAVGQYTQTLPGKEGKQRLTKTKEEEKQQGSSVTRAQPKPLTSAAADMHRGHAQTEADAHTHKCAAH